MNRNEVRIKTPCHEDWSEMSGDEKKRFCGSCSKHVHDLSAMTEARAQVVLAEVERPCVRYACNPDGTIRFQPASRRVFLSRAGMIAGGLLIGAPAAAAVAQADPETSCSKGLLDRLAEAFWGLFEDDSIQEEPEILLGEPEVLMGDVEWIEPVEVTGDEPEPAPAEETP